MDKPPETGPEQAQRDVGGRFAPGRSGNPSGRPKGSRNRVSRAALDLLDDASGEIVARLVELAKEGNPVALRLCIERIVPKRDRLVQVDDLPALRKAEDIAAAAARVIELVAAGEMSIEEARGFMALLREHRGAIETADLAVRIDTLEETALSGLLDGQRRKR